MLWNHLDKPCSHTFIEVLIMMIIAFISEIYKYHEISLTSNFNHFIHENRTMYRKLCFQIAENSFRTSLIKIF